MQSNFNYSLILRLDIPQKANTNFKMTKIGIRTTWKITLALLIFQSCNIHFKKANSLDSGNQNAVVKILTPNLDTITPLQLLNLLKIENGKNQVFVFTHYLESDTNRTDDRISSIPKDWIKKQHVDSLIKLIDDKTPTVPVFNGYASVRFRNKPFATVGIEALRMIEGYKENDYPSLMPHYVYATGSDKNYKKLKKDMKNWYLQTTEK